MELFFKNHGSRAAQTGSVDDPVHLIQQHALEAEGCYQHLFALLRQFLHGKVSGKTLDASSPMPRSAVMKE